MEKWFQPHHKNINALFPFECNMLIVPSGRGIRGKLQFFYEIWRRNHFFFEQGTCPVEIMEYEDQQCLGLFLLKAKRYKEKLLKETNMATRASSLKSQFLATLVVCKTNNTSLILDSLLSLNFSHIS